MDGEGEERAEESRSTRSSFSMCNAVRMKYSTYRRRLCVVGNKC